MKYFLSLFMLVSACLAFAQNANISVYSDKGLKFTVVLNGIDQNAQPATHVKVTGVIPGSYRLKVRFENEKLGQASRGMFADANRAYKMAVMHKSAATVDHHFDGVQNDMSKTLGNDANAKTNNYDVMENYVIRFVSESTANENGSSNELVVPFVPRTKFSNPAHQLSEAGGVSSSSSKTAMPGEVVTPAPASERSPQTTQGSVGLTESKSSSSVSNAYNSACNAPMDENTFSATKSGVSSQPTIETKVQVAKQIVNAVCMSVEQISGVMTLLNTDEAKLDFAKYAYDYSFDPQNYAGLSSLFELTSSVDDFNQFVASKKK